MTTTKHPVTEDEAAEMADFLERGDYEIGRVLPPEEWPVNRRGRPSLSAPGERSPKVTLRLPTDVHQRGVERAAAEGKTLSVVLREAVEAYLR